MLSLSDINFAYKNIKRRRLRTILTVSGIILGIFLVTALLFLGAGVEEGIKEQFSAFGDNTFQLNAGSSYTESTVADVFTEQDIEDLKNLKSIKTVVGFYEGIEVFKWRDEERSSFLFGFETEFVPFMVDSGLLEVTEGRLLRKGDYCNAIVSEQFAENAFSKELKVNSKIYTDGKSMQIIGITKLPAIYSSFGITDMVYTTKECANDLGYETPVEVYIEAVSEKDLDRTEAEIEKLLYENHNNTKDFTITAMANAEEMTASIIALVQAVVLAIAAISLIVGGIVISNTMYMATIERTKEIGTMKAVGATNKKILFIIVTESAFLGFLGGILGILLGTLVYYFATTLYPISFVISPITVLEILLFSIFLGAISGYLPAKQASKLDPVIALHYE